MHSRKIQYFVDGAIWSPNKEQRYKSFPLEEMLEERRQIVYGKRQVLVLNKIPSPLLSPSRLSPERNHICYETFIHE